MKTQTAKTEKPIKEVIRKKLNQIAGHIVDIAMIDQNKYYINCSYTSLCISIDINIEEDNKIKERMVNINFYQLDSCFDDYNLYEYSTKIVDELNKNLTKTIKILKEIKNEKY
jgi:hypothetical protein